MLSEIQLTLLISNDRLEYKNSFQMIKKTRHRNSKLDRTAVDDKFISYEVMITKDIYELEW